jgi:hypothetical protein
MNMTDAMGKNSVGKLPAFLSRNVWEHCAVACTNTVVQQSCALDGHSWLFKYQRVPCVSRDYCLWSQNELRPTQVRAQRFPIEINLHPC